VLAAMVLSPLFQTVGWGQAADDELKITIIEGDGFINNIRKRTTREPVVEVRDRNNKPLAGATVIFLLPSGGGPGGAFANGAQTLTVQTNAVGRAVATGFQPNQIAGQFRIDVRAEFQGRQGRMSFSQRNVMRQTWFTPKKVGLIGGVAAAATAVAVVVVTQGGGGGGGGTSVGVGSPTVGPR
jgi:hypothetical protein